MVLREFAHIATTTRTPLFLVHSADSDIAAAVGHRGHILREVSHRETFSPAVTRAPVKATNFREVVLDGRIDQFRRDRPAARRSSLWNAAKGTPTAPYLGQSRSEDVVA